VHTDTVANFETVGVGRLLLFFDKIDNAIHKIGIPRRLPAVALAEAGVHSASRPEKSKFPAFVIVNPTNYNRHLPRP
jgi:hypothetical protein